MGSGVGMVGHAFLREHIRRVMCGDCRACSACQPLPLGGALFSVGARLPSVVRVFLGVSFSGVTSPGASPRPSPSNVSLLQPWTQRSHSSLTAFSWGGGGWGDRTMQCPTTQSWRAFAMALRLEKNVIPASPLLQHGLGRGRGLTSALECVLSPPVP